MYASKFIIIEKELKGLMLHERERAKLLMEKFITVHIDVSIFYI
jgi:hypothetical protein